MDREEAERLVAERLELRRAKDFQAADSIRDRLRAGGWEVLDGADRSRLEALKAPPQDVAAPHREVTVMAVVAGWLPDAERWLLSVFRHTKSDFEALVVDASADPGIAAWVRRRAAERFRWLEVDPALGFAAAANAGIEAAAGDVVVLCDTSVQLTGDAVSRLAGVLADEDVAVAGPFGLRGKGTLKEFAESSGPEVDAIEGYCMAFRRADALAAGGFDPKFRFYRIADIELSFRLRARGGKAVAVGDLPVEKFEHRVWESTEPHERDRLSRRNMYRFLDHWGARPDLLVGQ